MPLGHHLGVDVLVAQVHMPDPASVAVFFVGPNSNPSAKHFGCQRLLGTLAVGLALLGRVDLGETNTVLVVVIGNQRQRVTIGNADNPAFERGTGGGLAEEDEQQYDAAGSQRDRIAAVGLVCW